ncbi:MAG: PEP-CTERM sorting domain-containing protein [Phycisphaerales bacterium]|nr:PEP-CTERM sorting domain-containing protein [Phycisphaerales bacterium]
MKNSLLASTMLIACVASASTADVTTTFDNGTEGWSISGRDTIDQTGGNDGANMHGNLIDVFGADIRNNTNGDFLGDLSRYGSSIELSIDIKTNSLDFFGQQVPRELVVELRDYDNDNGYPWTSVWFSLGAIGVDFNSEWTTYSVTIDDTASLVLPGGWGGTGDEDPNTFEPILPVGRTFDSVISSVDEIAFTTFVPGFFFGFTNMDLQVDNISISTVPAPSSLALIGLGGIVGTRRRR